MVNDVQTRAMTIQQTGAGGQQGGGGGNINNQMVLHEIKDRLNNVGNDVSVLINRPQPAMVSVGGGQLCVCSDQQTATSYGKCWRGAVVCVF